MRSTGRRSYLDIAQNLYKKIWFFPRKTGIPGGNAGISSDIPALGVLFAIVVCDIAIGNPGEFFYPTASSICSSRMP